MTTLDVVATNPIFSTIQGEGTLAGTPSVFLRLWGCDYHCGFKDKTAKEAGPGFQCDTVHSWSEGSIHKEVDVGTVAEAILKQGLRHLVVTGGNPLLQWDAVYEMIQGLHQDTHITLETQGSVFHETVSGNIDLLSVSPKLHDLRLDVLQQLVESQITFSSDVQIKIVVSTIQQVDDAATLFEEINHWGGKDNLVASGRMTYIIQPDCYAHRYLVQDVTQHVMKWRYPVRIIPQLHKLVYKVP